MTILPIQNKIVDLTDYNFGHNYVGQHRVWATGFAVEPPELYLHKNNPIYWLEQDFDSIPIISELTETIKFSIPCIKCHGSDKNIVFYTEETWTNRDFEVEFNIENGK